MRGIRFFIGAFSAAVTLSSAAACSHTNEAAGEVAPASAVGLQVRNDNFLDVDVYAVSEGMPTRLGTVTGTSSRTFLISPTLVTQNFQIVARPIGGSGLASTGSLIVSPGQTVQFTVGSILSNSSVFIR